jgi:S-adenosylmethionine uptake transporter
MDLRLNEFLMRCSSRTAPPATIAPLEYTALLWAFALDWLWWSAVTDAPLLAGAFLIAASGLLLAREARHARHHARRTRG